VPAAAEVEGEAGLAAALGLVFALGFVLGFGVVTGAAAGTPGVDEGDGDWAETAGAWTMTARVSADRTFAVRKDLDPMRRPIYHDSPAARGRVAFNEASTEGHTNATQTL
jgi:hypothetical protein